MKNATESLEHASVRQHCKAVRVPVIAANFVSLAEQAVKEKHYRPVKCQIESTGCRDRVILLGNPILGVPVKWAFFQKA